MSLQDLADLAWYRYQHWLRRLARPSGAQFDLEDGDLVAQVREWRGIWCACELEIVRVGACTGLDPQAAQGARA